MSATYTPFIPGWDMSEFSDWCILPPACKTNNLVHLPLNSNFWSPLLTSKFFHTDSEHCKAQHNATGMFMASFNISGKRPAKSVNIWLSAVDFLVNQAKDLLANTHNFKQWQQAFYHHTSPEIWKYSSCTCACNQQLKLKASDETLAAAITSWRTFAPQIFLSPRIYL